MADQRYAEPWTPEKLAAAKDERVAVVGAGPAGLTVALRLAQQGYAVTVLEKMPQPGGMMTYGIPAYRLPREPLFAEIEHIKRAGVDIRCNQELGKDFTLGSLKEEGYDAIVLALGAHKSRQLGIPGEEKEGVYHAIHFLRDIALGQSPDVAGKCAVVVGGGDAAMDAARSAWRLGAAEVHVLYRREEKDMPALREEIEGTKEEGVQFHFLATPVAVLGDGTVSGVRVQRQRLGKFDASGRRRPEPIPGSEFDLACDFLIPAIGQSTDCECVEGEGIDTTGTALKAGEALDTNLPGVFAAGDAVKGPATIIEAVGQGNDVAWAVDTWLRTGKLERIPYRPSRYDVAQCFDIEEYADARRPLPRVIPPDERCPWEGSFVEVELGFDEETAQEEARRCLRCDVEWLQRVGEPIPEPSP